MWDRLRFVLWRFVTSKTRDQRNKRVLKAHKMTGQDIPIGARKEMLGSGLFSRMCCMVPHGTNVECS